MGPILLVTGVLAVAIGSWRGYQNARAALGPLVHDGEPTRSALEATQRVIDRPRVRQVARHVGVSLAWLGLAMYGLFLLATATSAR